MAENANHSINITQALQCIGGHVVYQLSLKFSLLSLFSEHSISKRREMFFNEGALLKINNSVRAE